MGFGVSSYPYLYFIDPEPKTIGTIPGFLEVDDFYSIASTVSSYVSSGCYKSKTVDEFIESKEC